MTITLLTEVGAVPAGTCPFCHRPLDEGGCRVGAQWISGDLRASGGVEKVVDVYCTKMPTAMPTAQQIGDAIKHLREALRLSIRAFPGACAVSPHRLRQIESGEVEASDHEHKKILKALGFTVIG
jgi:DNA-binding transcriptional regulator YiaG